MRELHFLVRPLKEGELVAKWNIKKSDVEKWENALIVDWNDPTENDPKKQILAQRDAPLSKIIDDVKQLNGDL
jgi:hypothetical protein